MDAPGAGPDELHELPVPVVVETVVERERIAVQDDASRRAVVRPRIGLGLVIDDRRQGLFVAAGRVTLYDVAPVKWAVRPRRVRQITLLLQNLQARSPVRGDAKC